MQATDQPTSSSMKETIDSVNDRHTRLLLDYDYTQFFYMSDQVAFYLSGIPVVFLINGDHGDIHKATDDAEKIDYDFLRKSSQLTYFLAKELANRDEAPF